MRKTMANTHTIPGQSRRHIVKGMVGAAALARASSFATPLHSERTIEIPGVRHSTLKVGPETDLEEIASAILKMPT